MTGNGIFRLFTSLSTLKSLTFNQWHKPQSKLLPLIRSKKSGNQTQAFLSASLSVVAESEVGSGREGGFKSSGNREADFFFVARLLQDCP